MIGRQPSYAGTPLADRGYDADSFRNALIARETTPCIPSRRARKVAIPHDITLFEQRHRMRTPSGASGDWRLLSMRYDRCPDLFLSARSLAAVTLFWL